MRWSRPLACGLAATVLAVAAGCGGGGSGSSTGGGLLPSAGGSAAADRATATTGAAQPAKTPSLAQAVAQLFAVGFAGTSEHAPFVGSLAQRDWGVVVLGPENVTSPTQERRLVRALVRSGTAGGGTAPLVAAGPGALPVSTPAQPDQHTPAAARAAALSAARHLRAFGIGLALAPVADVGYVAGPSGSEAFASDPGTVTRLTRAAVAGWTAGGVAAAPGNFPGQGSASQDPEQGVATVGLPLSVLRATDVRPFAAVAHTAPAMQMTDAVYAAWDGVTPASLLPEPYDLLRRGLGFGGVTISGDLTATTAATGGTVGAAAVSALEAGADLLYVPGAASDQDAAYAAVLDAVRRGRVTRQRLVQALVRVEALKRAWPAAPAPPRPARPPRHSPRPEPAGTPKRGR